MSIFSRDKGEGFEKIQLSRVKINGGGSVITFMVNNFTFPYTSLSKSARELS